MNSHKIEHDWVRDQDETVCDRCGQFRDIERSPYCPVPLRPDEIAAIVWSPAQGNRQ